MRAWIPSRIILMAFLVILCGVDSIAAGSKKIIKIGMSDTMDPKRSDEFIWASAFADIMKEGGYDVIYYPTSSIGGEPVRIEATMLGLLEVNFAGSEELKFYSSYIEASDLPFLFDSNEMFDRLLLRTDFLNKVNNTTVPNGIRVVDTSMGGGMSGIFTARIPVDDFRKVSQLHIRAMGKVQARVLEAWKTPAVHVAWEEVSQALQTGIVDGYINPPIIAVMYGHQRQLNYFSDLRIWPSARFVTISENWYRQLSVQDKSLLTKAVKNARKRNRIWNLSAESEAYELLRNSEIKIIAPSRSVRQAFRKASENLYARGDSRNIVLDMIKMADQVRELP